MTASCSTLARVNAGMDRHAMDERVIFLLDYDSFFARCMQQAYPPLRGRPVGIRGPAGGSILIAASTEAKARGVSTGTPVFLARRLCPSIMLAPPDMEMYIEICTRSLQVLTRYTECVEPFSIDEAYMDVTDLIPVFGDAHMLAARIKNDLRAEVGQGITCSIGIAPNKMLAKVVSHFHKPDGITAVAPDEIPALLKRLNLIDICGIGPRVLRRLHRLGIYTVEGLGQFPRELLVKEFGVLGTLYWLWGQGLDPTPVTPYHAQEEEKSMGHTQTLVKPIYHRHELDAVLLQLCERTGRRLRAKGFLGRTLHVWVSYQGNHATGEYGGLGGRRNLPRAVNDTRAIYAAVQAFLPPSGLPQPVRRVSVGMSGLSCESQQLSLMEDLVKHRQLQLTLDTINDHFGERTILPAALRGYAEMLAAGDPANGLRKRYAIDG